MTRFKNIAMLSSIAMLLSSGTPAMSDDALRILLHCDAGHEAPLCDALAIALNAKWPDHILSVSVDEDAKADLTVRYVEEHRAKDWLSGHLIWQRVDGLRGVGPVVEYSVMDRALKPDDMAPYASQLVRSIEFPNTDND